MRKIITTLIIGGAAGLTVAGCGSTASQGVVEPVATTTAAESSSEETIQTAQTQSTSAAKSQTDIGEARAKQIALEHAGLTENDVTFVISKPDFDDGRYMYDVEFYKGMTEYDYEIDGYTGEIVSFDQDAEGYGVKNKAQQNATGSGANAALTVEDAKKIALEKAGLTEANVTFTAAHFEYDDGDSVYNVDFVSGDIEYEFEIDANSGNVREYDSESVYD